MCNIKLMKLWVKMCNGKIFALIFNQTILEQILMLTGTLGAFHFIENMLLYPEFTKMSEDTQWLSTNIKPSIKYIDVNCTQGKCLILNCFSSSYVFSPLCVPFKSL